jgi:hypothetical protein
MLLCTGHGDRYITFTCRKWCGLQFTLFIFITAWFNIPFNATDVKVCGKWSVWYSYFTLVTLSLRVTPIENLKGWSGTVLLNSELMVWWMSDNLEEPGVVCVHAHPCMFCACARLQVLCFSICTCICMRVHMFVQVHFCTCACMCAFVVCVCVCVCLKRDNFNE